MVKRSASLSIVDINEDQLGDAVKWTIIPGLDELIITQAGSITNKTRA